MDESTPNLNTIIQHRKASTINRVYTVMSVVVMAFTALYLLADYDAGLPVLEIDEGYMLQESYARRGLMTAPLALHGYPPLVLIILDTAQRAVEVLSGQSALDSPAMTIRVARIVTQVGNLISAYFIYRIGTLLHSRLTGLASAVVWVMLPQVYAYMRLALTEAYQALFIVAALYALVRLIKDKQVLWALLCTGLGLLAVTAKYSAFPVLGLGVGGGLYLSLTHHRKWWSILGIQIVMIAGCAVLLLGAYGASSLETQERNAFSSSSVRQLLDLNTLSMLWNVTADQLGIGSSTFFWGLVMLGTAFFIRRTQMDLWIVWFGMVILAICFVLLPGTFLVYEGLAGRYISPASTIWVLLVTLSLVVIIDATLALLKVRHNAIHASLFIMLVSVWMYQSVIIRTTELIRSTYPQTQEEFVEWVGAALPAGTIALPTLYQHRNDWIVFHPIWGSYPGSQRPVVALRDYQDDPPYIWLRDGIRFVTLTGTYPGDAPDLLIDPDEMLLLKAFPPPDAQHNWAGNPYYVYQITMPQFKVNESFGGVVSLIGYDIVKPSDQQIMFTPYWQLVSETETDFQMFVHLAETVGDVPIVQSDMSPAMQATNLWHDRHEIHIGNTATLTLPPDLAAGEYHLSIGIYDLISGSRLPLPNGDDVLYITTIEVGQN